MNEKNQWEELFDSFLSTVEFRLVKYPNGWGLVDKQGADLGDIESDRFEDAMGILDRMDVYIDDYFVSDIKEDSGCSEYHNWSELLAFAREHMAPEDLERYHIDLEILDMICNHPEEVNLENCCFEEENGPMKVGEWVVYTEDGLWFGHFGNTSPSYLTKKDAVDDVACASMDTRRTPKIRRTGPGSYVYTPKNPDTGMFCDEYFIERLTADNLERFQKMYYEAISEETEGGGMT